MRSILQRGDKFQPLPTDDGRLDQKIPGDLWKKCPGCSELIYTPELENNLRVCPKCGHHFRLRARERIAQLTDPDSFVEWDAEVLPADPLSFEDPSGAYTDKVASTQRKTGEHEALVSGIGTMNGRAIALAVCDFDFLGASMGSVFGEKLTRAIERCAQTGVPLMTVNASGGARMHEGLFSLMQMAKTVAAFSRLGEARIPHISLLADPCYGGVTASYATIADVIVAEPGALLGFAGPRVIEQITKQKLPEGFQTAEFLLEHGMIDFIIDRGDLKRIVTELLDHYARAHQVDRGESIPWQPGFVVMPKNNGRAKSAKAATGKSRSGGKG